MAFASLAATVALALLFQSTPSVTTAFHGTWTMEVLRSDSAQQEKFIGPVTQVISVMDGTLIIETMRGTQPEVMKYVLMSAPDQPGVIGAGTRRAFFDGAKLVTEGTGNVQGQTVSIKQARSLNAGGTEMTVESTVAVQHGYTLRGAQTYAQSKDVFTRTAK